jgi:hypothetical protein
LGHTVNETSRIRFNKEWMEHAYTEADHTAVNLISTIANDVSNNISDIQQHTTDIQQNTADIATTWNYATAPKINLVFNPGWDTLGASNTPFVVNIRYNFTNLYELFSASVMTPYTKPNHSPLIWDSGTKRIQIKYSIIFFSFRSVLTICKTQIRVYGVNSAIKTTSLFSDVEAYYADGPTFRNTLHYNDSIIVTIENGERLFLYNDYDTRMGSSDNGGFTFDCQIEINEI